MTTPRIFLAAAAALALAGAVAPASAKDMSGQMQGAHPQQMYQNGGIGKEEVARMDGKLQAYNLRMTFSEGKDNAYATGLHLRIANAQGKEVFALSDAGPMTDVKLPAGHYSVKAKFGGVERSASVDVPESGKPAMLNLHWPKDES